MKGVLNYISQNPIWGVILAALFLFMVIMFVLAARAGRIRNRERDKVIAALEQEKALRREFAALTPESFAQADERLLFGVAANIQQRLERTGDMTAAFAALPDFAQNIYALNYVFEDSRYTSLSRFFHCNGQPLTGAADAAVRTVIGGELAGIFTPMYEMFDDDNESVSIQKEKVVQLDHAFLDLMHREKEKTLALIAAYIRSHQEALIALSESPAAS